MFTSIQTYCDSVKQEFDSIPTDRKVLLEKLSQYISKKKLLHKTVNLVYICTHNSRRSHFGQVWGQIAAAYYAIEEIHTYSGGTEATAVHPNALSALSRIGFEIVSSVTSKNPVYEIFYDAKRSPLSCYSKVFSDPNNPISEFAAIMTCGEAEQNCPFIPGAELRMSTPYEDPKAYDDTELQDAKYDERCRQIARETLYVFSKIKP